MKSRKFTHHIKTKPAWLLFTVLAACQSDIVYHSYRPVPLGGWAKSDTLEYALPASVPVGEYDLEVGIRYGEAYPYRDIWLEISHNTQDTLRYATDTVHFFLADESGNKTGNGPGGLYRCALSYKSEFPITQEGNARTFRIVQIMKDNPLKGISDIGIQISRSATAAR